MLLIFCLHVMFGYSIIEAITGTASFLFWLQVAAPFFAILFATIGDKKNTALALLGTITAPISMFLYYHIYNHADNIERVCFCVIIELALGTICKLIAGTVTKD